MKKSIFTSFTLTILLLLIGLFVYYFNENKQIFGNDKDSIVKVITSLKGYEHKSIEILEIKDWNDLRVVGFLSNNSPGYIQFRKNEDGNFIWNHIQVMDDDTFNSFNPFDLRMLMFVANNENKTSKIQVSINGQKMEQSFIPYKATVAWINFPESENNRYEFRDYKYYDKDGNLIKELK